ncbi:MAG TPA: DNA mismatch endonuclease Vsr [Gammaproteobacteria bacterium]|nr:DNA mismatch endonuclease Vsr [Gammaproteobacteria bacterium]
MDVHDGETRSYNMSRIKGRDTKPEMRVRRACHRLGLRFRLHRKDLPGRPDLVFPRHKTVILVHGCYWHSHDCKYGAVVPSTNTEFWQKKRLATVDRDARNALELEYRGWHVLVYWECETKDATALTERIKRDFAISG